jgi:hypothetical protein
MSDTKRRIDLTPWAEFPLREAYNRRYKHHLQPHIVVVWPALQVRTAEVPSSTLVLQVGYPDRFLLIFVVPPANVWITPQQ